MSDNIFELKNFKEYLPLEVDISDKDYLHYKPILAPTQLKILIFNHSHSMVS